MIYTSYEDMSNVIRRNIWKVPYDVGLIVGVPRSGMICALMIAELLNKPVTDLDSFLEGRTWMMGNRGTLQKSEMDASKVLIIDDTFYRGNEHKRTKAKLQELEEKYDIIYGCVYAEGKNSLTQVDLYLDYNYNTLETGHYLYEWNMMHHNAKHARWMMFDLDGVICKNPPDDKDKDAYEAYLPNAIPMILPSSRIGAICTYRIERYREVTEAWLKRYNVDYGELIMFPAESREERNMMQKSSSFKAGIYRNANWAKVFIESDPRQAEKIYRKSEKSVFCYENGIMYK